VLRERVGLAQASEGAGAGADGGLVLLGAAVLLIAAASSAWPAVARALRADPAKVLRDV
jgi:hypothetical protein